MPVIGLALCRIVKDLVGKVEPLHRAFGNVGDPLAIFCVGLFWLRRVLLLDPGDEIRMVDMVAAHDFYVMRAHIILGSIMGQVQRCVQIETRKMGH